MTLKSRVKSVLRRVLHLNSPAAVPPNEPELENALLAGHYVTEQEIRDLKAGPRTKSVLLGKSIEITDSFWYLHSLKEIFAGEVYRFRSNSPEPYIIDCGANIGLSAIYFKRLFPKAKVIAFEPDPNICAMLTRNLRAFDYHDVVIENKAVWREESVLNFSSVGSLSSKVVEGPNGGDGEAGLIKVPAVRLAPYLDTRVDFLKIDIEGPEVEVLADCRQGLRSVERLFVEYHSDPDKEQEFDQLCTLLREAGFRLYIKEAWNNLPYPFLREDYRPCYDLQLNVFAYRSVPR